MKLLRRQLQASPGDSIMQERKSFRRNLAESAYKQVQPSLISIFIAVNNSSLAAALENTLGKTPTFKVVGTTTNSQNAISQVYRLAPQVVILEYSLPRLSAESIIHLIKSNRQDCRILVLMESGYPPNIEAVLSAGADGCCLKQVILDIAKQAIPVIAGGGLWLSPLIRQTMDQQKKQRRLEQQAAIRHRRYRFRVSAAALIVLAALALTGLVVPILKFIKSVKTEPPAQSQTIEPTPVYTNGRVYRVIEMR